MSEIDRPTPRGIASARSVDHYGLSVPDLDQAIRFFVTILGAELLWQVGPFTESPTGAKITSVKIAMLRCGPNLNVELLAFEAPEQRTAQPAPFDVGASHLAFFVDDFDAAAASLRAHGVKVFPGPIEAAGTPKRGERIQYFLTPWGSFMELLWRPEHLPYEADTDARLFGPRPSWREA